MNVLVFDSSTDIMFVNLSKDRNITDSRVVKSTQHQYNSAFLVSTISDILKNNNIKMQDVDAIGINIGPGSFTGLRASVTVARVIAQQLDISAVGIPSMKIYSMLNNTAQNSFCIMDARRGMAFVGIYNKNAELVVEPCIMNYEKALSMTQKEDYFIISDSRMAKKLEDNNLKYTNFEESDFDFGQNLMKLTLKTLENTQKEELDWQKLKPLYIQTPPV